MGCEVNGPGEASHADAGLAGGRGGAFLLFAGGERIGTVDRAHAIEALLREIEKLIGRWCADR
jgi:(E)-4-hydroxy-3-methylbut-2-enyl-diphosphate synthase